ncbi:hypothetical protein C0J52_14355 [Blattella germanica]|nr:hypothetical protein C0J52_14355 [Blattella germanica]
MIRGSPSYKKFGNWPTGSWSFRGSKFGKIFKIFIGGRFASGITRGDFIEHWFIFGSN